jgi:hypothetical protein
MPSRTADIAAGPAWPPLLKVNRRTGSPVPGAGHALPASLSPGGPGLLDLLIRYRLSATVTRDLCDSTQARAGARQFCGDWPVA